MAILLGIILLAVGISLAATWHQSVLIVFQGNLPLFLILGGIVIILVGYSERKAAREYNEAMDVEESAEQPIPRDKNVIVS